MTSDFSISLKLPGTQASASRALRTTQPQTGEGELSFPPWLPGTAGPALATRRLNGFSSFFAGSQVSGGHFCCFVVWAKRRTPRQRNVFCRNHLTTHSGHQQNGMDFEVLQPCIQKASKIYDKLILCGCSNWGIASQRRPHYSKKKNKKKNQKVKLQHAKLLSSLNKNVHLGFNGTRIDILL